MKILVTGAGGFIGGILTRFLFMEGHDIIIGTQRKNLDNYNDYGRIIQMDWTSEEDLKDACKGIDVIIHTAGMNSVECAKDPAEALNVNGLNTAKLVQAAVFSSVKKFIYFSTAHVYANPLVGDINENSPKLNIHPYATSHLAGEYVLLNSFQKKEIDGCVIRLANVFGSPANQNDGCWKLFVNNLCKEVVQKNKMTILSTGFQERNFITTTQLCIFINKILNIDSLRKYPKIYNLGNPRSYTLKEMVDLILKQYNNLFNSRPKITFGNKSEYGDQLPLNYFCNNLKAIDHIVLNDVESEIKKLLVYCKKNFS